MSTINVLGIDLAKNVFQLHGNDKNGKTVLKKTAPKEAANGIYREFAALFDWR
jgi:hypothetical protein